MGGKEEAGRTHERTHTCTRTRGDGDGAQLGLHLLNVRANGLGDNREVLMQLAGRVEWAVGWVGDAVPRARTASETAETTRARAPPPPASRVGHVAQVAQQVGAHSKHHLCHVPSRAHTPQVRQPLLRARERVVARGEFARCEFARCEFARTHAHTHARTARQARTHLQQPLVVEPRLPLLQLLGALPRQRRQLRARVGCVCWGGVLVLFGGWLAGTRGWVPPPPASRTS